jgi:hypothetical protein
MLIDDDRSRQAMIARLKAFSLSREKERRKRVSDAYIAKK